MEQAIFSISPEVAALVGLFVGFFAGIGFSIYLGLADAAQVQEKARLMIFEKQATQMSNAELWAIVKANGESSSDGVIALKELKGRKEIFGEEPPIEVIPVKGGNYVYQDNRVKRLEEGK